MLKIFLKSWLVLSLLVGCATTVPIPPDVRIWQGWPKDDAIVRTQEAATLKCVDPKFQDFVCLQWDDFMKILDKCHD